MKTVKQTLFRHGRKLWPALIDPHTGKLPTEDSMKGALKQIEGAIRVAEEYQHLTHRKLIELVAATGTEEPSESREEYTIPNTPELCDYLGALEEYRCSHYTDMTSIFYEMSLPDGAAPNRDDVFSYMYELSALSGTRFEILPWCGYGTCKSMAHKDRAMHAARVLQRNDMWSVVGGNSQRHAGLVENRFPKGVAYEPDECVDYANSYLVTYPGSSLRWGEMAYQRRNLAQMKWFAKVLRANIEGTELVEDVRVPDDYAFLYAGGSTADPEGQGPREQD